MKDAPIIRRSTADDLDRLAGLFEQVHHLHADLYPDIYRKTSRADLKSEMALLLKREHVWVHVAEAGQDLIGYALTRLEESPGGLLLHPYRFLFLEHIAVDSSWRRQGVGAGLLQRVRKLAADLKVSQLHLLVWSRNEASLRFFTKHGFSGCHQRLALEIK